MTKDEALKLALEALEGVHRDPKGWWNFHVEITAIKEALAQPEQGPEQEPEPQPASEEDMTVYRAIAANYHKDLSTPPKEKNT